MPIIIKTYEKLQWHLEKQRPNVKFAKRQTLKILQNFYENPCAGVSLLIKLQTVGLT